MASEKSASGAARRKRMSGVSVASAVGTTIGWYDVFLYGTMAALVFSQLLVTGLDSATATTTVLDNEAFLAWGWRLPFLFSAVLIIVGMFVRLMVKETPLFEQMQQGRNRRLPPAAVLQRQWRGGLSCSSSVCTWPTPRSPGQGSTPGQRSGAATEDASSR